ncbi:MAG: hypothetical protein ACLUKN_12745 [Bacilli bacterium]
MALRANIADIIGEWLTDRFMLNTGMTGQMWGGFLMMMTRCYVDVGDANRRTVLGRKGATIQ